jgi:hypothetical protein
MSSLIKDQSRTVEERNLAAHIGRIGHGGRDKGKKFYLADYLENSKPYRRNTFLAGLNSVCRKAGFTLMSSGCDESTMRQLKSSISVAAVAVFIRLKTQQRATIQRGKETNQPIDRRRSNTNAPSLSISFEIRRKSPGSFQSLGLAI